MIERSETIRVRRTSEEAFAYLADFRSTAEWDATARNATKLTPGPVRIGTRFHVNCALPLGSIDLAYEVAELQPCRLLVLRGSCPIFEVRDTIEFLEEGELTRIDYCATFTLAPLLAPFTDALRPGLERMGRSSAEGLRQALEDRFPAPGTEPAQRALAPHVARFTRWGYHRARKHWNPVSASLRGRNSLVTGATSGLGAATAMELARRGASVTLVARDAARAEHTRRTIVDETGNDAVAVEIADLTLLAEVDRLCHRLRERGVPLHILVNNAGALFAGHEFTAEGHERSLALLLLSPYRLTLGIRPLLEQAGAARVVNIVSGGMYTQKLSLQALACTPAQWYSGPVAYARAKRALMAVTRKWANEWRELGIAVNAMHPGWVDTPGLAQSLPQFYALARPLLRTPEQGADTIIWLAAASEAGTLAGGLFLDREAQPLHLKADTRESGRERKAVLDWLRRFDPWHKDDTLARAS